MSESTDRSLHSLRSALAAAALLGRGSDSLIAHISPREAKMLRKAGGSGARNPDTGLLEFDGGGENSPGAPMPSYGPGSGSGLYAWGSSDAATAGNVPPNITGFGLNTAPGALTATAPSDFTPVAPGADIPAYVSSAQGDAQSLASRYGGGTGQLGTFDINGQTNYGWTFGNGLFAPAMLPTSGEIPTSLNAAGEGALYPAALAGETLQNTPGLPQAWTDVNNVLTPTAQANTYAQGNLPGEQRAFADTGPSTFQRLLGVAGPIGMFAGGALLGPLLLGGEAAGAGAAGAGAAAGATDASTALLGFDQAALSGAGAAGGVDLASLGIDPTTASLLGIGGGGAAIPGFSAGGADLGAAAAGAAGGALSDAGTAAGGAADAGAAGGAGVFDLNTLLGLDPATTAALTTGDLSGLAGGLGLVDAASGAGSLAAPSLTDTSGGISLFPISQTPSGAIGGDLPLTSMPIAAPSDLGAGSGVIAGGGFDEVPATGGMVSSAGAGNSGFLSSITDPINKFVTNNSGLLKALGLGASALSLGRDLMGNNTPTALTGGAQLDALAKQLATPGGANPQQAANLANLENTAQTINQGQVGTLTGLQGQAIQSGKTMQDYLNTGTLPPAVQASVDQATQAAITAIKAGYAARGEPANSSMEIQDINTAKQTATAKAAELMQQLSTQGLTEQQLAATIGQQITGANTQSTQLAGQMAQQLISNGLTSAGITGDIYRTLLQADQNQQTQTGTAIARLAAALAGGNTGTSGGLTAAQLAALSKAA